LNVKLLKLVIVWRNNLYSSGYEHSSELVWAERQSSGGKIPKKSVIEAPLFHIQICGENLLTTTSFVVAQVVTSHYCLGVPEFLFYNILSWLDSYCVDDSENRQRDLTVGNIQCYFNSEQQIHSLPSLTFQLAEEGKKFSIPLSSLASPYNTTQNSTNLCIIQSDEYVQHPDYKIIFGLSVMENFYTVVDITKSRVAFYQNASEFEDVEICPKKPKCRGGQEYDPATNECQDPKCSAYLFQYVDHDTKQCKVYTGFYVSVAICLLLISGAEIFLTETRLFLERRAHRSLV